MQHFSPPAGQEFNFFTETLPDWEGWLATLVVNAQGRHASADGNSKGIGNPTDLQLLLALRSKASVIVTTGQTARAESYQSSRFAPIAVITRNPESLSSIPLLESPGSHRTITLSSQKVGSEAFEEFDQTLTAQGLNQVLFEGGPSTLALLLTSQVPTTLVMSIANLLSNELSALSEVGLRKLLHKVLPASDLELVDAYSVGPNVVSVWSRRQL